MTKALFKKQIMEVFSWVYKNRKDGKNRSAKGTILYGIFYLIILCVLGFIFYSVADMLCAPLISVNLGWLYNAIMGLIAVLLGVFGSVFNTYASLYQAKDNDLLLSMPISSSKILLARLTGVYAMGVMYELSVVVPAIIVYFMNADLGVSGVIFTLLIPVVLSVFILFLSSLLGWIVALISSRLKNKNFIVVVLSLAFFAAYYYCYGKAYSVLQGILANPQVVGDKVKNIIYPFYHMGLAAEGNVLSMLIFTAIIVVLFLADYFVLQRSFLKLATANRGTSKARYKQGKATAHSVGRALFGKELRRFLGSANYMLNCGLGIVFMIVSAVAIIIKGDIVMEILNLIFPDNEGMIVLIAVAAICTISSMNDMAAPSISLEGKNLWLLQSLPVKAKQVLIAKLNLQLVLTLVPALIFVVCTEIVIKPSPIFIVLIPVVSALFILFMAVFGLFMNLKRPNLTWTNEIVPIKQSMSVMISLLGGWVVVVAFAAAYYFLKDLMSPLVFLICTCVLLLIISVLLLKWLMTKGAQIFETL